MSFESARKNWLNLIPDKDDGLPRKYGCHPPSWGELAMLWDVPILFRDLFDTLAGNVAVMERLLALSHTKFLELGTNQLLTGYFVFLGGASRSTSGEDIGEKHGCEEQVDMDAPALSPKRSRQLKISGPGSTPHGGLFFCFSPYFAFATSAHNSASAHASAFLLRTLVLLLPYFKVAFGTLMVSQLSHDRIVVFGEMGRDCCLEMSSIKKRTLQVGKSFARTLTWRDGGALGDCLRCRLDFALR